MTTTPETENLARRTAEARQADQAMRSVIAALTTARNRYVVLAEEYGLDLAEIDDDLFGLIKQAIGQAESDREALVEMVQAFTEEAPQ